MTEERKPESIEEVYRWLLDGGWVVCKGDLHDYIVRMYDGQFERKESGHSVWVYACSHELPVRLSDVGALIPAEKRETLWQPVWSYDAKGFRDASFWRPKPKMPDGYFGPDPVGWLKQTRVNGKCVSIEYVLGA